MYMVYIVERKEEKETQETPHPVYMYVSKVLTYRLHKLRVLARYAALPVL